MPLNSGGDIQKGEEGGFAQGQLKVSARQQRSKFGDRRERKKREALLTLTVVG